MGLLTNTRLGFKRLVNRKRIAQEIWKGSARVDKLKDVQDFGLSLFVNVGLSILNITKVPYRVQIGD